MSDLNLNQTRGEGRRPWIRDCLEASGRRRAAYSANPSQFANIKQAILDYLAGFQVHALERCDLIADPAERADQIALYSDQDGRPPAYPLYGATYGQVLHHLDICFPGIPDDVKTKALTKLEQEGRIVRELVTLRGNVDSLTEQPTEVLRVGEQPTATGPTDRAEQGAGVTPSAKLCEAEPLV